MGAYVLNLVLIEVGNPIDDHPRDRASKVDEFMHDERHDSSCENVILHESIPCSPKPFEDIKVNIIFGDFVELAPIGMRRRVKKGGRSRIPAVLQSAMQEG